MKTLAFYLPQYHPFAENDEFWGKGFTEWRNVARATPQYDGHIQPNIPSELGFYDLRLDGVIDEQYQLAKQYGIDGFVPYLYWFCDGKVVMDEVIDQFSHMTSDTPYALCWANENWTRRWDGQAQDVLIEQRYENPSALVDYLLTNHFDHSEYIKDKYGRPVFIIYRPHHSPKSIKFVKELRQDFEAGGHDILILGCASFEPYNAEDVGVDGIVQFPPHRGQAHTPNYNKITRKDRFVGGVYEYAEMAQFYCTRDNNHYQTVCPAWDNTPRRMENGHIFHQDETACAVFEEWVRTAVKNSITLGGAKHPQISRKEFMFINAWNEWAEGAFLEPDIIRGRQRLEALARGLNLTK